MSENVEKRTASQRIEDLERVLAAVYQAVSSHRGAIEALAPIATDMTLVKDALKLINKRVEAVVQAAKPESGITAESVSALLVQMNVADLQAQVQGYLASGHIAAAEEVADNTFLVCEEVNSDGAVVNPRIQFRLDSQDSATQESLKGKKVGDSVSFGEGKLSAKLLEIYNLLDPSAASAEATSEAASETQAETAAEVQAEATQATAQDHPIPTETPVVEFVASDLNAAATA